MIPTVRIASPLSADNQTGYVVINKDDFDESKHELFDEDGVTKKADLTVAQIKEALAAKGIEIPDGVTKKADLQALLDTAPQE
jgi:hypothetical protein